VSIKDQLIEMAEGVIKKLELKGDMDMFYEVQDFIVNNWDVEANVTDMARQYRQEHSVI